MKVTGYSTQVNVASISGAGGEAGEVLTNNGFGDTVWTLPGLVWGASAAPRVPMSGNYKLMASLQVPPGRFAVSYAAGVAQDQGATLTTTANAHCWLEAPNGAHLHNTFASISPSNPQTSFATQGLMRTDGGVIELVCNGAVPMAFYNGKLMAQQVGSAFGSVTNG